KGKIRWYGVSSNSYPLPGAAPAHTSVARTLAAAEAVSANHHFRVVQLPLNLYESGAALESNHDGKTVLQFCCEKGIGVLANRPLNAYHENRLVRLADFLPPGSKPPGVEQLRGILRPLAEHEQKLAKDFGGSVGRAEADQGAGCGPGGPPHQNPLMAQGIATSLLDIVPKIRSVAHWEQAAGPHVIRPIQGWLQQSRQTLAGRAGWEEWQNEFLRIVNVAFERIHGYLAAGQQEVSDEVRVRLAQGGYPP